MMSSIAASRMQPYDWPPESMAHRTTPLTQVYPVTETLGHSVARKSSHRDKMMQVMSLWADVGSNHVMAWRAAPPAH